MSKLALLLSAIFLASLLSACATTGTSGSMKVKCPACGHEFDTDGQSGGMM